MRDLRDQTFSWKWVFISMAVFIGIELILGSIVGGIIVGRYKSISLGFLLQGLLHLASFFVGGLAIGLFSPGIRIREPAVGAFCSVALMLAMSLFTPYAFIRFSLNKMLLGGAIAFGLALLGARIGERLSSSKQQ